MFFNNLNKKNKYQKIENSTLLLNKRFKYKNNFKKVERIKKENPYLKYSKELQSIVKDLKADNYHVFSESFIDNIFVFYKIVNKKLFFITIKMHAIYQRYFSYENDFSISNYIVNITDIERINISSDIINITLNKSDKNIKISFFQEYNYFTKEIPTEEQLKELSDYKKTINKNFINLSKKINNIIKNNFSNILSL